MKCLKTARSFRNLILAVALCLAFSPARAYDPNKPWIYSMRFMMDTWGYLEMYSTATVVSKPSNFAALRVVTSTTNPTYQLLVTTQGYVGIATASPAGLFTVGNGTLTVLSNGNVGIGKAAPSTALDVNGTVTAAAFSGSGASLTGITASQVGAVANDGSANPVNLLSNGDFENWAAGTSALPDMWSRDTAPNITVSRESVNVKIGTACLKVIQAGAGTIIYQDISSEKGISYWRGRTVTASCWVKSNGSDIRFRINDGVTPATVMYGGSGDWEFLTITRTIADNASVVQVELYTNSISTSCFDGAMLVEGSNAFAFSPKPPTDYEEGTWTGALVPASGSITMNTAASTAYYSKIGKMVTVSGSFHINSVSSPSGDLQLTGLPFAAADYYASCSVYVYNAVSFSTPVEAEVVSGATAILIRRLAGGTEVTDFAQYMQAGTVLNINVSYFTP